MQDTLTEALSLKTCAQCFQAKPKSGFLGPWCRECLGFKAVSQRFLRAAALGERLRKRKEARRGEQPDCA